MGLVPSTGIVYIACYIFLVSIRCRDYGGQRLPRRIGSEKLRAASKWSAIDLGTLQSRSSLTKSVQTGNTCRNPVPGSTEPVNRAGDR